MTEAGMVDAQFGNIRVLLPYADFEDDYQGVPGSTPVAFPGGLSSQAIGNVSGYRLNQQDALPVPRGSRISVGIPLCFTATNEFTAYRYWFVFRDQNLRVTRNPQGGEQRQPYHYPIQGAGARDSTLLIPQEFTPIDARYHCLGFEQMEPTLLGAPALLKLYPEAVIPQDVVVPNPLVRLPTGAAVVASMQQGIYDTQYMPKSDNVIRDEYQLDSLGDELIVLAQKLPDNEGVFAPWDFAITDLAFSNVYGRGGLRPTHAIFVHGGIRVCTGTNP